MSLKTCDWSPQGKNEKHQIQSKTEIVPVSLVVNDEPLKVFFQLFKNTEPKLPPIDALISYIKLKHTEHLETCLRVYAEPPIKGEITAGKLKWRGIVYFESNEGLNTTCWLEQRGKQIGPKIKL